MISSEVQRTLVKSPPELWAELSDPDALARHLGELGEIRITRAEPEKRVEWEAESTSGSVLIKPSGWGTKVTLSVTREIEAPPHGAAEVEPDTSVAEGEAEAVSEIAEPPEVDTDEAELEPESTPTFETEAAGVSAESESSDAAEEHAIPGESVPQPSPRRGFFARLFGRRQPKDAGPAGASSAEPTAETLTDSAPTPSAGEPKTSETPTTEPTQGRSAIESLQARFQAESPSDPVVEAAPPRDLAAELKAAEETAAEEVTAVLTAVLDRLGAAHHRPFSRA